MLDSMRKSYKKKNWIYNKATIRFNAESEWVKIDVFDLNSRHVATAFDGNLSQGEHNVPFELENVPQGEYIVQVRKESGVIHSKLIKM